MRQRRVPSGWNRKTYPIVKWTNRLGGSLFNLKHGTANEIEFTLHANGGGSGIIGFADLYARLGSLRVERRSNPIPR